MRLPLLRLRLWMLVVLVALVAIGIGAERTIRRVRLAREKAAYHAGRETNCRGALAENAKGIAWCEACLTESRQNLVKYRDDPEMAKRFGDEIPHWRHWVIYWRSGVDNDRLLLSYHIRMRQKYERACRFPWPAPEPDPPEPDSPPPKWEEP